MAKAFQVDTGPSLTTNLVSYYKLEDATDFYSTNDLTNNGPTPFNAGKVNNAADGGASNTTKYLKGAFDYGISPSTQNMSIAFWLNNTTAPGAEEDLFWIGKNAASTQFFRGWYENVASVYKVTFYRRGSADDRADWIQQLTTGTWYHFVGTYDGTNIRLYTNNTLRATTASSGSGTGDTTAMSMLSDRDGSSKFSGLVDEWGVWTKALNTTEIGDLWNGGSGQTMIDSAFATFLPTQDPMIFRNVILGIN